MRERASSAQPARGARSKQYQRAPWRRGEAVLLPGRPAAGDKESGRNPKAEKVRAICCSGGGIRAAAFSLGGMQYLNSQAETREGKPGTIYSHTDFVAAVSGGSYIAASYALVSHGLGGAKAGRGTKSTPVYAP